jgi:hypothetical protein
MRFVQLVGQRLGVQVPDVYQAGGPDQPRGDEQDHARQRGRHYHTTTVSAARLRVTGCRPGTVHGWRMDRGPARMGIVKATIGFRPREVPWM